MEPWKLFILEVFFQTKPEHYMAAKNGSTGEYIDKKCLDKPVGYRIADLMATNYPSTLKKFLTMTEEEKKQYMLFLEPNSKN